MRKPNQIAVVGSGTEDDAIESQAREVCGMLAERGVIVICGGLGGAMRGASQGTKEAGGTAVGIIPGTDKDDANPFVDVTIVTGMGHARNALVVGSADGVIALAGGAGTLSEVALALKMRKPVVGLLAWGHIDGVMYATTPADAVRLILEEIQ
ncbi:MAG: TIGR00725 family protein [Deltaproteobacteria bacterium]|nr:TIGR00725 family protein [Candidatus Zymogenaceae bacterium]